MSGHDAEIGGDVGASGEAVDSPRKVVGGGQPQNPPIARRFVRFHIDLLAVVGRITEHPTDGSLRLGA